MSINGGIRRKKSSNETIRSYRGSISNSSVHTISTAESSGSGSSHKDLSDLPGQCPATSAASFASRHSLELSTGQYDPSIFDHKSLEKPPTCLFSRNRNQSLSTICTTREPNSDCESDIGSISPPTPKQEPTSSSLSLPTLEDEAEIPLPSTSHSPEAIVPTRATEAPSPSPSTSLSSSSAFAAPPPPLNGPLIDSYGESQLFATTEIFSSTDIPSIRPTSFFPPPTDRILGTDSRTRSSSTVTFKEKNLKGILGFMNGLRRKSVDFRDSNKRLEICAPYDPVHVQHVGLDPITGKLAVLPGTRQDLSRTTLFPSATKRWCLDLRSHAFQSWSLAFTPEVSKPVGVLSLPVPKIAHSRGPVRPNLDLSNSRQALPKPPRNDKITCGNATATATSNPVKEHRARPTTVSQQSTAAACSATSAGATPRRHKGKKENKVDDADLMKRLRGICKDADPTRLYRNLVKIGQG